MKNAEVVLNAKEIFAEDLGDLWEIWDEKPKWITAKELYQEDVQDFWESWEDNPKILSAKELDNDNTEKLAESTSSSEEESVETNQEESQRKIECEYQKMHSKGNLVSAKEFFKEDDNWWNDTVKIIEDPKVISAKEFFKEDTPWWKNDNVEEGDSDEYSEVEEDTESYDDQITVKLKKHNAVLAKDFFKEDECWWRDAVDEIIPPKVVSAKEYFKDETAWWETEDDQIANKDSNTVMAKDAFKEDKTWLDNFEKDDECLTEECDEAYESILSDTSTMYSVSEEVSSDQFQECDWWLSPDNSEASNVVIKAKDMFREDVWWDNITSDGSEGTDTKTSETNVDSMVVTSIISESESSESDESDSEETHAESIVEEEVKNNTETCDVQSLQNKIDHQREKEKSGAEIIDVSDDNARSEDEEEDIQETKVSTLEYYDSTDPALKLISEINHGTLNSSMNYSSEDEVSRNLCEEYYGSPDKMNLPIVSDIPGESFLSSPSKFVPSKTKDTHNCLTDKQHNSRICKEENIKKTNINIFENNGNNTLQRQEPIPSSREEENEPTVDNNTTNTINSAKEALLIKSFEIAINKMDDCLARLDARIAVVDSQLSSDTSDLGSNDSLNKLGSKNTSCTDLRKDAIQSNVVPPIIEEAEKPKGKFQVFKVNVRIPESNLLITTQIDETEQEGDDDDQIGDDSGVITDSNKHDRMFDDLVNSLINDDKLSALKTNDKTDHNEGIEVIIEDTNIKFDTENNTVTQDGSIIKEDDTNPVVAESEESINGSVAGDNHKTKIHEINYNFHSQESEATESNNAVDDNLVDESMTRLESNDDAIKNEISESNINDLDREPEKGVLNQSSEPENCVLNQSPEIPHISTVDEKVNYIPKYLSNECHSLCVSREQSVERDSSQPRESPNISIDKNLWRCSTYEPISISEYDHMAYLIGMSASFPGNLKDKNGSEFQMKISQESLLNEPYNIESDNTNKTNNGTKETEPCDETKDIYVNECSSKLLNDKQISSENSQSDIRLDSSTNNAIRQPSIPRRSKDLHRNTVLSDPFPKDKVSPESVKPVTATIYTSSLCTTTSTSTTSSSGISQTRQMKTPTTMTSVSTLASVSPPVGSTSSPSSPTLPKQQAPSPGVLNQPRPQNRHHPEKVRKSSSCSLS